MTLRTCGLHRLAAQGAGLEPGLLRTGFGREGVKKSVVQASAISVYLFAPEAAPRSAKAAALLMDFYLALR